MDNCLSDEKDLDCGRATEVDAKSSQHQLLKKDPGKSEVRKDSTVSVVAAAAIVSTSIVAISPTIPGSPIETRAYSKRYAMLAIFAMLSASNSMQWIQYSIIAHIIKFYYSVSYAQVDWTSMIYMLTYLLLIFPGSWFLDKYGLRKSVLIGALGNCFGAWVKMLSTSPDNFAITFIGQTIVGSSQFGIALGFIIPPFLVHMGSKDEIEKDLSYLFLISAVANTLILLLIFLFFDERPPLPPSLAQAHSLKFNQDKNFIKSLKKLSSNKNYMILLITYGINVGVFYAISTLLSQMIIHYHKDAQTSTGTTGLIIVVSGMVGSVVTGYILDKTHHFKATNLAVYFFSFIGMVLFTVILPVAKIWEIFLIAGVLGFFMTGYLPLGFEFAAELTFPTNESTTSGILNASAQIFGIAMTVVMGNVIYFANIFWCNTLMSTFLLIGCFLTALIKSDLRRQNAHTHNYNETPDCEEQILSVNERNQAIIQ